MTEHFTASYLLALLHQNQGDNGQRSVHNAAADRLALALSLPARAVAGVALAEQQAHTV